MSNSVVTITGFHVYLTHLLVMVEVPRRPEVLPGDEGLLELLGEIHSKMDVEGVRQLLRMFKETGAHDEAEKLREGCFHQIGEGVRLNRSMR